MTKPLRLDNGRVAVTRTHNFVEWCAWREWLHIEFGRTFFPEKLVVWDDFPPLTYDTAMMIAGKIRHARECETINGKKVEKIVRVTPESPDPWARWPLNQRLEYECHHREDFGWNP